MKLEPLGEAAYIVRGISIPAYQFVATLEANPPKGLLEAVPAYETVGLYVDSDGFDVADFIERYSNLAPAESTESTTLIEIPCTYDGVDLGEVSALTGLSAEEVVDLHSSRDYRCFAIGFCPGFPYLGYLSEELVLPRRSEPRARVPAGSVAIAGRQTGIYPLERPGGWWLIGRTDLRLVDLDEGFFALKAGDRVRFVPS